LSLIFFTLFSAEAATTWYVDSSAAGTHNGTSWANAWTSLSQISGVSAGDTVYISGGAGGSSHTYSVSNWKPAGGNSGAPITYQIGQDAAHDGTVTFSGSGTWLTAPSYSVISGDAGDGNEHFVISGYSQAANINGTTGVRISYINLGSSSGSLSDGIDGQGVSNFELDHCYAYLTSPTTDHFMSVGFNGTTWHQNLIHDNAVYVPHQAGASGDGADGFQLGGVGYSLYNNTVVGYDTTYTGGQHQDGWQSTGPDSYLEFYGNKIVNIGNYALFADAYWGGFTHVRVYNNLFFMGGNYVYPGAIVFGTDGGYTGTSPCQYNDIIIANNLADGFGAQGTVVLENPTGSTHPTVFVGDIVANNVSINGGHLSFNNDNTVVAVNNPFLTTAQGPANFVSYSSSGGTNNNFHLLAGATTLIGQGTNLSGYFTTDKDGNNRVSTGNWDIGPYAYTTNGVVVSNTPIIQVTPGSIAYGTMLVGTSKTNSFTVQNNGTGTLSGSASVASPFSIVSGSSYSLGAGQTQAVVVVFSPVVASNYNQSVSFSGGNGTTTTVTGSATNVPVPTPIIQVSPASIGYGTILAGTSVTNSFTVKNMGTGTLSGSASVASPFSIVSGSSYSLGAGQTQAVVVVFSPQVASNYSQSVSVSGGGNGTNVMLSGVVTNSLVPPLMTIISEKVTADVTNPITLQFCTNLSSAIWRTAGTFAGSTNLSFTNLPVVLIRGVCNNLTGSVTLTWPASTNPSVMGYKVYYGTSSGVYGYVLNVGKATTATISNLVGGTTYYFLVDTYSALGANSPYLNEVSATPLSPVFSLSIGH